MNTPSNSPGTPAGNGHHRADESHGDRLKKVGQDTVSRAKHEAEARLEDGKTQAATAASTASHAMDDAASTLANEGYDTLAEAVSFLADRLGSLGRNIESRSVNDLARDAQALARRNPALFIAGGVAIGIALSRFFKASAEERRRDEIEERYTTDQSYGGY